MEKISNDYRENVRVLDGLLGVGRSCDMVSRDYLIGGRRARLWVVDGFGSDSILERMGAFWLTLKPENVVGLTEMQDFLDRYITFSESNVTFDISDAVTSVFLGKSLLAVEGLAGVALMDAKGYPSRSVHEPPDGKVLRGSHDGFVEAVVPNMALLRRRIRDPHLTMEGHKVGSRTHNDAVLCYLDDRVDQDLLRKLRGKLLGLDGIVAIGGDGTFRGAQDLSRFGVAVVGVPGTIDNDIVCTDYTIGFDTAANTAVECIDRLRDTMQSHERCSVVEVMGRHAGYLALYVGVAVGATAVLVPEHQYDFEKHVAEKIRAARLGGKTNFMIVVAEGAASAMDVGKEIKEHLGLDPRVTILGHIQRGGSPTAKDRVLATRMGYEAVRVLAEGMTNRVICVRDDQIVNVDIDEGLAMKKTLNAEEFEVMTVMTGV